MTDQKLSRIRELLKQSLYPSLAQDADKLTPNYVHALHAQIAQNENRGNGKEIILQHLVFDFRILLCQGNRQLLYCKEFLN